ncbi:MAG: ATP-dependent metallopeptidase FtsH/Yme1/Tma family protein, partial [Prevotella sp.]|nr:ATP-dependent metallopeptidase FtsH/Yme1/Tma family protein [Prevotella sp.]
MENNNKDNMPKMPKFNMNWIYVFVLISLAVVFFVDGTGFVNNSASVTKDYTEFVNYVDKGYASRVVVNKRASNLRMYVKPQHIRDVFNAGVNQTGKEPFVKVQIGSVDNLELYLNTAVKKKQISSFSYDNKSEDGLTDILISVLPWVALIIFWLWIMRRMGGGASGGGVFSVGKSKARMYEKGNDLGITFKDVAGQAGAKQEV